MIGWIIFGSILLILIIILAQSVKVTVIYDANPEITVKILCFTLFQSPADPKTLEKKKRKKQKKEERERKKQAAEAKKAARKQKKKTEVTTEPNEATAGNESTEHSESSEETKAADTRKAAAAPEPVKTKKDKKPKKKLDLDFQMIMDYVRSASPPIKRLFKKIRIRDVYIDWVTGSDEAGKTALKYGGLCTAIYSMQEWLTTYFDTKIREINIEADFQAEKDDIFMYLVLKLRISTLLGCVIWLGVRVLKTYLRYNKKPAPAKHKVKMKPAAGRGR